MIRPGDLVAHVDAPEVLGAVCRVMRDRCMVLWSCGGNDLVVVAADRLVRVRHQWLEDTCPCEALTL